MDISMFKDLLFSKAKEEGFEDVELFYKKGENFSVTVYKGQVEKYQNNAMQGASFRGSFDGAMGYAYTENVHEDVIDSMIKSAKENAQIINLEDSEIIYEGDKSYTQIDMYNNSLNSISTEEKIQAAKQMEEIVLSYDEKIKTCNGCVVSNAESYTYIANSKGLELEQKNNYIMAYANAIAEKDGQTKTAGEVFVGFDWNKFSPNEVAQSAASKAISNLGAKSIKSGEYKAIIQNEAFIDLFSAFIGSFFAENVQKGFSLLKDKIGTKIASSIITIVDESLLKDGFASSSFDSEGVACFNKTIVENGELKLLLYNLKSALKDNVKSTGNGFRSSFKSSVSTQSTNFYIKNGEAAFDEMVSKMQEGVVITELAGLHSGTNSVSGDFSLSASGFLVEGGKITKPVEQITIAGNFFNLLNMISMLGNDLKFESSAIGSPSVMVEGVRISGL